MVEAEIIKMYTNTRINAANVDYEPKDMDISDNKIYYNYLMYNMI